jgi:catechol 2,3-dioxygenase-like lactoylglutathione lyase family enzyme
MKRYLLSGLVSGFALTAHAQVLPFNEAGVTMGHHHLMVPDVDAQTAIWVDVLGGEPSGNPPLLHLFADPALETPIAHRAMAFVSTDPDAQRAWWENVLGAATTQEGAMTVSTIPGARLFFSGADTAPAPTRGRALDHTGIGVADVGAFCEQIAAKGVICELLFGGAAAMITDPAGVAIEVNAGLESR